MNIKPKLADEAESMARQAGRTGDAAWRIAEDIVEAEQDGSVSITYARHRPSGTMLWSVEFYFAGGVYKAPGSGLCLRDAVSQAIRRAYGLEDK